MTQIHPGAALLATDDGGRIVTRPGSHGDLDSLWLIQQALRPSSPNAPKEKS
ncbi:hypothetical protein [Arachnia propionica]|uniref:hypothetical protein n=1 Tax=Arachnia propionica TaxID=1750 RepID=UPI001639F6B4|nr:hypothetical protein [Arachnia propionica]